MEDAAIALAVMLNKSGSGKVIFGTQPPVSVNIPDMGSPSSFRDMGGAPSI